jgi:hypothetical protein
MIVSKFRRYVWRTYWLLHDGEKLIDNEKTIKE